MNPTQAELKRLEAERNEVRKEWARRFLVPKDYTRVIVILGLVVGLLLCGTIAGFVHTLAIQRDNQRELLCSLAETQELIVAYVEARGKEAAASPTVKPPPEPPSAAILREFSDGAGGLRERAGGRCPFPSNSLLQVERKSPPPAPTVRP